jgi:hypothetical protein
MYCGLDPKVEVVLGPPAEVNSSPIGRTLTYLFVLGYPYETLL